MFHAIVAAVVVHATDTPVDYSGQASTITTVLGGLAAGLGLVIAGGLAVRGITWGVPKIVRFFTKMAG